MDVIGSSRWRNQRKNAVVGGVDDGNQCDREGKDGTST